MHLKVCSFGCKNLFYEALYLNLRDLCSIIDAFSLYESRQYLLIKSKLLLIKSVFELSNL